VDLCRRWIAWVPGGNLGKEHPQPVTLPPTPEAARWLDDIDAESDRRQDELGEPLGTLWSRCAEKARKLALLHAASRMEPGQPVQVDGEAARWGCELATWATERMIYLSHQWVSDGAFDTRRKRVLRAIESAGTAGITATDLCRKTQALSPRERQEALEALVQSGEIGLEVKESSRPGRNATRYIAHAGKGLRLCV
jgi:hypothetical protein